MDHGLVAATTRQTRADVRRAEWWRNGAVSGFVATVGMTLVLAASYLLVRALGNPDGSTVERWFAALGDNPVTRQTTDAAVLAIGINLIVGWVLALVYARWAEPMLSGPGWRKGMIFSLVPFLLSLVVFLPFFGGGLFGIGLGAGPLPIVGNLVLHLVYGGILGTVYALMLEDGLDGSDADWGVSHGVGRAAGNGVGIGVVVGAVLGLVGRWMFAPTADPVEVVVMAAVAGGAVGVTIGALVGLAPPSKPA